MQFFISCINILLTIRFFELQYIISCKILYDILRRNEMKSTITFFPVDNGDMTLIKLSDKTTVLIDTSIGGRARPPF
jgi:hypothetical protein